MLTAQPDLMDLLYFWKSTNHSTSHLSCNSWTKSTSCMVDAGAFTIAEDLVVKTIFHT